MAAGLDTATLQRSIVLPGTADAWQPVFDRLDAGENIVLGVFGASVAQVRRARLQHAACPGLHIALARLSTTRLSVHSRHTRARFALLPEWRLLGSTLQALHALRRCA